MKQGLPFARKKRQLKFLSKQLRRAIESGRFEQWSETKRNSLLARWRRLWRIVGHQLPKTMLRRLLGPAAALVLGLALTPQSVQAQTFAPPQENPFGLLPIDYNVFIPSLADLDADGDLDVIVCNYSPTTYYFTPFLYENVGEAVEPAFGEYVEDPWGMALLEEELFNVDFADIDGDGDLDAFGATSSYYYYYYGGAAPIVFYENIGTAASPAFAPAENSPFGMQLYEIAPGFKTLRLADVDGDGDEDVLLGGVGYNYGSYVLGGFYFFENTGTADAPAFGAPQNNAYGLKMPQFTTEGVEIGFFDFADMDGDGDMDLVCAFYGYDYYTYEQYNLLYFYENISDAGGIAFADPVPNAFGVTLEQLADFPVLGDLDGDSDIDMLTCHFGYTPPAFHFYANEEFVNAAPVSGEASVTAFANNDYAFSVGDFPFTDADGDALAAVRIESLIDQGSLTFQGNPVSVGTTIPADQISDLVFAPNPDEFGDDYAHFNFAVFDGLDYSDVHQMTIHVMDNVATNELPFGASAKLFPNPTSDRFQLQLSGWPSDQEVQIRLLDFTGKVLSLESAYIHAGTLSLERSVEHLPQGQYLLHLTTAEGTYRFVVHKQ